MSLPNILTIISCHTNSDTKIRSLIHNIKYFLEISSHIAIINSEQFRHINIEEKIQKLYHNIIINDTLTDPQCYAYKNRHDDLRGFNNDQLRQHWIIYGKKENRPFCIPMYNIYFDYIPNDKFVCHGKWIYYLNNKKYKNFDNIILANDSFVITRTLIEFKKLIRPNKELVALLESYQTTHHYPDFLRAYNISGITKLLSYYKKHAENITNFYSVILHYEINSSHIFNSVDVLYKNINKDPVNIHSDNVSLKHYLYKNNYPIIKIKKILSNYYNSNELPADFIAKEYIMLNVDLDGCNDTSATTHFLNCGINEGRLYKPNQHSKMPDFLETYLKFIGFE